MPRARHYVGPAWPPHIEDYDYVLTLCPSDLAWEFLRRNPDYQRDYNLNRKGLPPARALKTGYSLTRIRRRADSAFLWDLCSFRRSGATGTDSPSILVEWSRNTEPRLHFATSNPARLNRFLLTPPDLYRRRCHWTGRR